MAFPTGTWWDEMSAHTAIREVPIATVLRAPEAKELFRLYAEECSLPELGQASPHDELYETLAAKAGMKSLAVFEGDELVGFATVLSYTVPHYGKKVAATESIFIAPGHRAGLGSELLAAIETDSRRSGCAVVLYSAPCGSRFARMLSLSSRYRHSNQVYLRDLSHE